MLHVKNSGVWKEAVPYVKSGGVWVPPKELYVRDAGVWKPILNYPTAALLHFDGVNGSQVITDSSKNGLTISVAGNAQISTAQSKFGGSSVYFDGTGDYLFCDDTAFAASGDFTAEVFANFPARGGAFAAGVMDFLAVSGSAGCQITIDDNEWLNLWIGGSKKTTSAVLSVNTWHHVAVSRASNVYRFFVNGSQVGGAYTDATALPGSMTLGAFSASRSTTNLNKFIGYMDEFRFTKGLARYTANFTAPASPFTINQ